MYWTNAGSVSAESARRKLSWEYGALSGDCSMRKPQPIDCGVERLQRLRTYDGREKPKRRSHDLTEPSSKQAALGLVPGAGLLWLRHGALIFAPGANRRRRNGSRSAMWCWWRLREAYSRLNPAIPDDRP